MDPWDGLSLLVNAWQLSPFFARRGYPAKFAYLVDRISRGTDPYDVVGYISTLSSSSVTVICST